MNFSRFKFSECCKQEAYATNSYLSDMDSFLLIETNVGPGGRAV